MQQSQLTPNSLAFIGLCNEFCIQVENAESLTPRQFVESMTRLLPRIYIAASDLSASFTDYDDSIYLDPALDEDSYESIRRRIEALLGADDTYLEVFEEDMKYSETPIGASISEQIADIFQVLYNFVAMIKSAPEHVIVSALFAVYDDFTSYWSRSLCNVMRPLNQLRFTLSDDDGDNIDNQL